MDISACIADWDYFVPLSASYFSSLDETRFRSSAFTLLNDSVVMNCDFAELYLAQRSHLPQAILPSLDQFLANCTPNVSAELAIPPDYELPAKVDHIWSALAPHTVQQRLAAILGHSESLLYDTIVALGERASDSTGRNDPVIETGQDVLGFLQLWIGVHAEALTATRGFVVSIG